VIEVNGVKSADFKSATRAKELFDTLIIDIVLNDAEEPEEESEEEASEVEVNSGDDSDLD
jgi:hypothetical protein